MRRWSKALIAVVGLGLFVVRPGVRADDPPDAKDVGRPRPPTENLQKWKWYFQIDKPEDVPAGRKYFDFIVPPAVFDKANVPSAGYDMGYAPKRVDLKGEPVRERERNPPANELSDLRLRDANDQEIPYALFVRQKKDVQVLVPTQTFNSEPGPDRAVSLSLEVAGKEPRHNQIEINTTGVDYRRHFTVRASDDKSDWTEILKGDLIYFRQDRQEVNVRKFTYPESRRRYLRVTVEPDPGRKDDEPKIESVKLFQAEEDKGLYVTLSADLGPRAPSRVQGVDGSLWPITFGGNRVPVETLIVRTSDVDFERPYQMETRVSEQAEPLERWAQPYRLLTTGTWKGNPLEANFNGEVFTRELRLGVADASNPPLKIDGVEYRAPARQLVFARSGQIAWPVRLYCGNASAPNPAYDFRGTVEPTRIDPFPLKLASDAATLNPNFTPPAVPWTERHPWLVYVVLGVASLVLLGIMALLARQALRRTPEPAAQAT